MNNQQRFNELKWKFFWEQKRKEIFNFFSVAGVICGSFLVAGLLTGGIYIIIEFFGRWPEALQIFVCSILVLGLIVLGFSAWIINNLRKAEARAKAVLITDRIGVVRKI